MRTILLFSLLSVAMIPVNGQRKDSLDQNQILKNSFGIKQWVIPATLISTGIILQSDRDLDYKGFFSNFKWREERNEHFPTFSTHLDDRLQFAPALVVFGLSISGIHGKNDLPNQTALFLKTELLMGGVVYAVKKIDREPRPDTGKKNSFPSGHTAQAFAAATFLAKEYGYKSIWISIAGYTTATTVGVLRILNNRHWLSDIIAGAGFGILSAEAIYATHQFRWGKGKANLSFVPGFNQKEKSLAVVLNF